MIHLGVVVTPALPSPLSPTGARHCTVALQPDGRVVDARVAHLGQGIGRGVFVAPFIGDEVLVLLPGGDVNAAVVLGGLGSTTAPNPLANDSLHALLMHPLGVELRTVDGLPAHGIVTGLMLPDLLLAFQALLVFATGLQTVTSPATLAAIAPAAAAFAANPAVLNFIAQLTLSAGPNTDPGSFGIAPYASPMNKVTW